MKRGAEAPWCSLRQLACQRFDGALWAAQPGADALSIGAAAGPPPALSAPVAVVDVCAPRDPGVIPLRSPGVAHRQGADVPDACVQLSAAQHAVLTCVHDQHRF